MKRSSKWFLGLFTLVVMAGLAVLVVTWLATGFNRVPRRSVLRIDLSGAWPEDDPGAELNALFGVELTTLPELVAALHRAAEDERIAAVQVRIGFLQVGWAKAQEIREALLTFRQSGKPLQALIEYGNDGSYYLASAATDLRMVRTGSLWLDGISAEIPFYAGPLARVGIEADLEQIGEYKNGADVMERRSMSPAHRESMDSLLDGLYEELVQGIASGRGLSPDEVRASISEGPFSAQQALATGLVDALSFPDEAWDALETTLAVGEIEALGLPRYVATLPRGRGARIAVVNCIGTIMPGPSQQGLLGDRVMGSDTIGAAIREAWEDDGAKAIVLRIDSPGGSPLASDIIWREVERARQAGIPVVASMSDVAASGGYWIAMGADRVVAQPSTITGSIGIYGGKYVMAGLHELADYEVVPIERGANAGMNSSRVRFTPAQRELLKSQLREVYDLFLAKTAEGRGFDGPEAVDAVARGRVWTGRQGLERGLVDELGDLRTAIASARELAGIDAKASVSLESYPRAPTLFELLFDGQKRAAARQQATRALLVEATGLEELPALGAFAGLARVLEREGVLAWFPERVLAR